MAERDYLLIGDNEFRQHVRRLGSMGYGRMLQIVSQEWYWDAKRRGDPVSGVLVANACLSYLPKRDQEAFVAMAEYERGDTDGA